MSNEPDPTPPTSPKPDERRRPRPEHGGNEPAKSAWVAHDSSYALDPWGVAIRALRKRGIKLEE